MAGNGGVMQYIIDIVLLAIFALVIFLGVKKGLFYTLFELAAYVVSVLVARLGSVQLSEIIYKSYIESPIKTEITGALKNVTGPELVEKVQSYADSIPTQLDSVMELIGIDKNQLVSSVTSSADQTGKKLVETIMDNVVHPVSTAIIQTVLFILIAVVLSFILRLIIGALDKFIKDLPVIGKANKALGGVFGTVKGIIVVGICAMVIGGLACLTKSEKLVDSVNSSYIVNGFKGIISSISGYSIQ